MGITEIHGHVGQHSVQNSIKIGGKLSVLPRVKRRGGLVVKVEGSVRLVSDGHGYRIRVRMSFEITLATRFDIESESALSKGRCG